MGEKCPFCEEPVEDLELHACRGTMVWEQRRELVPKGTADYLRGRIATLSESLAAKDARLALLEKVAEAARIDISHCPYCDGRGYVEVIATGAEHDPNCDGSCVNCPIPVPIRVQEECEGCGELRAALDAAKEGK